jgi:tetraacyldisaccharide 4'-kinase
VAKAAARCQAAVLIGPDATGAAIRLPPHLPVLRADLRQDPTIDALVGRTILAFAGLAIPEKFFGPLHQTGAIVAATRPFPDHHPYTAHDLEALQREASALDAMLVTTPKDAVRLPPAFRARVIVIGVGLVWEDVGRIDGLLDTVMAAGRNFAP